MWDHFIQDVNERVDTYGVVADNPQRVDMNCRTINHGDYLHQNAIDYNEVLDQIIISSRVLGEVYILDHSTTSAEAATEEGGKYGRGGGLMYRWGDPQNWRMGKTGDKILFGQHSVNWIESSLTNLVLFNNGADIGTKNHEYPGYSTALEFEVPLLPNGTYFREEGKPYGPLEPTWVYKGTGTAGEFPTVFYSERQGGTYRLPNGNTLVSSPDEGWNGRTNGQALIFEVTYDMEVVWSYNITMRQTPNPYFARALKYPKNYLNSNLLGSRVVLK